MKNKEFDTIENIIFRILWFVFLILPWEFALALKEAMKPLDKFKRDSKGRFLPVKQLKVKPRFENIYNDKWQITQIREVK